jgi:hypothetical protein
VLLFDRDLGEQGADGQLVQITNKYDGVNVVTVIVTVNLSTSVMTSIVGTLPSNSLTIGIVAALKPGNLLNAMGHVRLLLE